jgi:hypothetical protein
LRKPAAADWYDDVLMRAIAPAALLLAITAGFYWKLTLSPQFSWAENPEAGFRTVPSLGLEARELRTRRLLLWDPMQWGGENLLARAGSGAANPLLLPLFALPLQDGHMRPWALHWWWVLLHWGAALAAYGLCREAGAGRAASAIGGSLFALGGFVGASPQPQWISAALWCPVVLRCLIRVMHGSRRAAAAAVGGAALGLAFLSGNYEVPAFLALAAAGVWIYALAAAADRRRALAGCAGLFVAIALLVSAVDLVPRIAYGWTAGREAVPYQVLDDNSAYPRALLGMIVPGWSVNANGFVGAIAMLLAAAGLATRWERRAVRVLAVVALGATVMALGREALVHGALYALLPWVARSHVPAMAIAVAQAALCALVALGFDGWPDWRGARAGRWALALFGLSILAVYLVLGVVRIRPADEKPAAAAVAALLAAGVMTAWDRGGLSRRGAAAALLGLMLVEVGVVSASAIPETGRPDGTLRKLRDHEEIAAYLRHQPGWFRVDADPVDIPYNFGDWFGIEQAGGATPPTNAKVARLSEAERRRLFGVRYYLGRKPAHPGQVSMYESESGVNVFRDLANPSPVWTEREGAACGGADQVRVESRRSIGTVLVADMRCPGTVVVGDAFAPGWRAWVDGRRVPIREMHGVVRGVNVPGGSHRIEILYKPWALYAGAWLTLAGLAAALWLARRRRN